MATMVAPQRQHSSTQGHPYHTSRRPAFHLRLFLTVALSVSCYIEGSQSFTITQRSWDYKGHHVGYEDCRRGDTLPTLDESPDMRGGGMTRIPNNEQDPVLVLNGFGVGSFHQHRLMPKLLDVGAGQDSRVVYGVDYLGQGRSWPRDCNDGASENEKGLRYCIDTWADQVINFIENVILPNHKRSDGKPTKIHLVGNSVGGHLSVVLASKRPDLIDSICLLNATPVWGLNLPAWSGHLPAPAIPKRIGRYLFDRIRDLKTIEKYLENAYANREAFDEELVHQIRGCTEGPGGHAAFASILWSPPATFDSENASDFHSNLAKLDCDVLLVFGKNDPWCKPAFAKRMYNCLSQRPPSHQHVHRYIELENVGHCPNHEAPQAVGRLVSRWLDARDRGKDDVELVEGGQEQILEPWGDVIMREINEGETELSLIDKIITKLV